MTAILMTLYTATIACLITAPLSWYLSQPSSRLSQLIYTLWKSHVDWLAGSWHNTCWYILYTAQWVYWNIFLPPNWTSMYSLPSMYSPNRLIWLILQFQISEIIAECRLWYDREFFKMAGSARRVAKVI